MKGKIKVWYVYTYIRDEKGKYIRETVEDCIDYRHAVERKRALGKNHFVSHRFDDITYINA